MTETSLHRALADERRSRIAAELEASTEPLDAHELGHRVRLHPNTVRWHLGILADAGLVVSSPAPRGTPGRPRIVYALARRPRSGASDEYRLLATILAGTVSEEDDGAARAELAGRAWGRHLAPAPAPFTHPSDEDAVRAVVGLLDAQGFEPEAAEGEVRMRRCPFHDLAETHPAVVCSVHRGLVDGALAELGSSLEVDRLDVFVEPDLCVAHLRHRAAA